MRKLILLLVLSSSLLTTHAQYAGYYGKKTFIEFNGNAYVPVFNMITNSESSYLNVNNNLMMKRDILNYGFTTCIGRAFKGFGLALELGYAYASIETPNYYWQSTNVDFYYGYNEMYYRHEMIDIKTMTIMPKIEFTQENGLLPIGFNHQIGIGWTNTTLVEKDYLYKIDSYDNGYYDTAVPNYDNLMRNSFVNYNGSYKGLTFLYAFNIRTPLSKSLLLNYGIRYTLNMRKTSEYHSDNSDQYIFTDFEASRAISRTRFRNLMTFNLGLTYVF